MRKRRTRMAREGTSMRRLTAVTIAAITMLVASPAFAQGPIKIGFLAPLSGAIAQAGKDMYSGCELFWEESGGQIAGRKLEVILEDNEGIPATALTRLRKLVETDHVHMAGGGVLSQTPLPPLPP